MDEQSNVQSVHHIEFHVNNALQSAFWYCCNFGFRRFAIRRRETTSEIAVRNGDVILIFKCALMPKNIDVNAQELALHGDFVKDVAFKVDNINDIIQKVTEVDRNIILMTPTLLEDTNGSITIARISGCNGASVVHTLIQKSDDYNGIFLPGFTPVQDYRLNKTFAPTTFVGIDHVVEGHIEGATENILEWYSRILALYRFWSIDDALVSTENSAIRASIIANKRRAVQIVIAEPMRLRHDFKGQIQEFLDYNGGNGVQHIALRVSDIYAEVASLRARGVEFLHIPDTYYDELEMRLSQHKVNVIEDLNKVRELELLLDFDDNGYLLQIFTKPMQDRPTFFIEIIQRHNFNGFGAGNFKALFAAVEREQQRREAEKLPFQRS